jgi:hypothetical protein
MDYADELRKAGCVIPNLDCLSTEAADLDQAARLFGLLAALATEKAVAMRARTAGKAGDARDCEAVCDKLYFALPPWAKW